MILTVSATNLPCVLSSRKPRGKDLGLELVNSPVALLRAGTVLSF